MKITTKILSVVLLMSTVALMPFSQALAGEGEVWQQGGQKNNDVSKRAQSIYDWGEAGAAILSTGLDEKIYALAKDFFTDTTETVGGASAFWCLWNFDFVGAAVDALIYID